MRNAGGSTPGVLALEQACWSRGANATHTDCVVSAGIVLAVVRSPPTAGERGHAGTHGRSVGNVASRFGEKIGNRPGCIKHAVYWSK